MKTTFKLLFNIWILIFGLYALSAHANRPSFNYASVSYALHNVEGVPGCQFACPEVEVSFDGIGFVGSMEFKEKWFAEFQYSTFKGERTEFLNFTAPASSFGPPPIGGATTGTIINEVEPDITLMSTSVGYQIKQYDNSVFYLALGVSYFDAEITSYFTTTFRDATGNIVPQPPGVWDSFTNSFGGDDTGTLVSVGYRSTTSENFEYGVRLDMESIDDETSSTLSGMVLYRFTESYAFQVAGFYESDESEISAGLRYMF